MYLGAGSCILIGMGSGDRWRLGHRPGLDGLRAVAVTLVVLAHAGVPHLTAAGSVGVVVFFVLSGFLIASLLLEETDRTGRVSIAAFYRRRALRLLPALFVMVAATALVGLVVADFTSRRMILGSLLYASNWVRASGDVEGDALGHTWSLSIEEQFYLVAPFVVLLLHRRPRLLLALCGVGAVASLALRAVLVDPSGVDQRVYNGTDTRLDGLLIGIALAVLVRRVSWRPSGTLVGVSVLTVTACSLLPMSVGYLVLLPSVVAVSAVALILYALDHSAWLGGSLPVWIGRRSYGIYLWHYPVVMLVLRLELSWVVTLGITVLATGLLAAGSWRFVEQPFLRLKDRQPARPHAPEPSYEFAPEPNAAA
jgi:peptidoglycan/LPS O-acetylase OafA/YrhL